VPLKQFGTVEDVFVLIYSNFISTQCNLDDFVKMGAGQNGVPIRICPYHPLVFKFVSSFSKKQVKWINDPTLTACHFSPFPTPTIKSTPLRLSPSSWQQIVVLLGGELWSLSMQLFRW
jgi:hypothetical protein